MEVHPDGVEHCRLVLAAAGMLLQIAGGSSLYPSLAGPIVLTLTAAIVAFGPARWTPYPGLLVPLVLGIGAIVASGMNGGLLDQLLDATRPGVLVGSLLHLVGLTVAVIGAVGMTRARRGRR